MPLPPDFLALVPCLAGWPASFLVGYRLGYAAAPRRVLLVDGEPRLWAAEAQVSTGVEKARHNFVPVPRPGGTIYLDWTLCDTGQWIALWTAHNPTESALTGKGNPFSKPHLVEVRDRLIEMDLAYWKNPKAPQQGWALRDVTRRAIKRKVRDPYPAQVVPTPKRAHPL